MPPLVRPFPCSRAFCRFRRADAFPALSSSVAVLLTYRLASSAFAGAIDLPDEPNGYSIDLHDVEFGYRPGQPILNVRLEEQE